MLTSTPLRQRFEQNSQIACATRRDLSAAGVTALSLIGPAGSGKTCLIEALLSRLDPKIRAAVIVGNRAAAREAERLACRGIQAVPLVTDNLTAGFVRGLLGHIDVKKLDLLLIEADVNAIDPAEFDFGQHLRTSVFSVAGGDDRATEFPFLVAASDLILLTKTDLLPFVTFDVNAFASDIDRMKPDVSMLRLSVQSNEGLNEWCQWVESRLTAKFAQQS